MQNIQLGKSLGHLFHFINLNMRKKLDKDIRELGLTSSHQFGVLLLLSKSNLSQKEISDSTLADEPSTTRMLERMIKKKLISKKKSDKDKRKQIVFITNKGKELLKKAMPLANEGNKKIENILSSDELENLFTILNKIKDGI